MQYKVAVSGAFKSILTSGDMNRIYKEDDYIVKIVIKDAKV